MPPIEEEPASSLTVLAPDAGALNEQARQAWTEPMAVTPLGGGRYGIEDADGAEHVVDLLDGTCSCSGHEHREAPCKHRRRVAIEINHRRLPSPREVTVRCRRCGRRTEMETSTDGGRDSRRLCDDCRIEPGDLVFDREREEKVPLVVVAVTDQRADEVEIPRAGCTVAEYGDNRRYSPGAPVVDVIYPYSVTDSRRPKRYSFPLPRLERPQGGTQTTLPTQWND